MIENFVKEICVILKIETPSITYGSKDFSTETMLARCSSDGNTIQLKEMDKPTPDLMFAIAHELRHVWQIKYEKSMMDGYKDSSNLSIDEYNMQEAELDANAFALVVMDEFFGLTPQFEGLSANVKSEIRKKAESISL